MSEAENGLLDFVSNVDWNKYADDAEVLKILKKIKEKVDAINDGSGEEDDAERRAKVVIVGDGAVGKTCLFITFAQGNFPKEYVPTVFENYSADINYQGEDYVLQMWDTAGQEDYDRLRPLSYPGTDVAILCFSLVSENSFDAIREKWNPEINHFLPNVPKILVGTKLDLREAKIPDPHSGVFEEVTTKEGEALAKEIGASYVEVSPLKGTNLKKVFEEVIRLALANKEEEEEEEEVVKKSSSSKKSSSKDKSATSSTTSQKSSSDLKKDKEKSSHRRHRSHKDKDDKAATGDDGKKKKRSHRTKEGEDKDKKKHRSKEGGEEKKERRSRSKKEGAEKETAEQKKERRERRKREKKEKEEKDGGEKKKKKRFGIV